MVSAAELKELEAEHLRAEIAVRKMEAAKFRAEGSYLRRKESRLKLEQEEAEASLYEQRIYEFSKEVREKSVDEAITTLSEWRARNKNDIVLRLSTAGGDCIAGFALYDYILALRAENIKVYTVALGWAASMGGILLQAGTKRYIAPNAHMLIHGISTSWVRGKIPEVEDWMVFISMLEQRGITVLAERSTLPEAEIAKRMSRKDWWLGADEVVELGFADDLWPPKRGLPKSLPPRRRRRKP